MTYYKIEIGQEDDGRWIAEIPALPGVLCYGPSKAEAIRKAKSLALRVLADRIEHKRTAPKEFAFA